MPNTTEHLSRCAGITVLQTLGIASNAVLCHGSCQVVSVLLSQRRLGLDVQSCNHREKTASPKFPVRLLFSENIKEKQKTWDMLESEFVVLPMLCCVDMQKTYLQNGN